MTSIPEFDSEYIYPTDFGDFSLSATGQNALPAMWDEGNFPFCDEGAADTMQQAMNTVSSASWTSFPERFGIPGIGMAEPALPDFSMGDYGIGVPSYETGYPQDISEFEEKFNGFTSNFQPVYAAGDVLAIQESTLPKVEEPNLKACRYSEEERKSRILRYLKKRNQRNFNKTIKYACRKILADRRVRVRGRFARNSELGEEAATMKNTNSREEELLYYNEGAQMKDDGEDWLQEAMTSLVYLPYIS